MSNDRLCPMTGVGIGKLQEHRCQRRLLSSYPRKGVERTTNSLHRRSKDRTCPLPSMLSGSKIVVSCYCTVPVRLRLRLTLRLRLRGYNSVRSSHSDKCLRTNPDLRQCKRDISYNHHHMHAPECRCSGTARTTSFISRSPLVCFCEQRPLSLIISCTLSSSPSSHRPSR